MDASLESREERVSLLLLTYFNRPYSMLHAMLYAFFLWSSAYRLRYVCTVHTGLDMLTLGDVINPIARH